MLCVLHRPDLARRYADRILGMRAGKIMFDDRPGGVSDHVAAALYEQARMAA